MAIKPPAAPNQTAPADPPKADTGRRDLGPGSMAGNLTRDPELGYTPSGRAVASLRVAVQERKWSERDRVWKDGEAEFFDVTCWGQLAENVAEHLAKGNRIVCEGRWEAQSWQDKEDNVQERTVFVARDLGPSLLFTGARVIKAERRRS